MSLSQSHPFSFIPPLKVGMALVMLILGFWGVGEAGGKFGGEDGGVWNMGDSGGEGYGDAGDGAAGGDSGGDGDMVDYEVSSSKYLVTHWGTGQARKKVVQVW
ncbi:hypothetical protein M422DRAFT_275011 [Sphaerobolus stellatus SS14]|uniref:Uncharacterized protein n=1 Tax=Sphaerobolus stellatus (strain SS14) TaxID=990650 RepID=A0A0C9UGA7_SPHS4|nr:hypothetical protein M422DRAFT_275011 [Sphaerobolus stellatus SS14]